jgi:hypothetical protein
LLNKRTAHCLNKRIRFQAGSIVITLPPGLTIIFYSQSCQGFESLPRRRVFLAKLWWVDKT